MKGEAANKMASCCEGTSRRRSYAKHHFKHAEDHIADETDELPDPWMIIDPLNPWKIWFDFLVGGLRCRTPDSHAAPHPRRTLRAAPNQKSFWLHVDPWCHPSAPGQLPTSVGVN